MSRRFLALLLVVTLAFSIGLTGCSSGSSEKKDDKGGAQKNDTIKIGFISHQTGDAAVWGISEANGAKLAVEEINKAGGVLGKQLELFNYDGRGNAADTVNATKRLIQQDKVVAVIGTHFSGPSIAMAPILEAAKVPQLATLATNPKVTVDDSGKARPYTFRLAFIDPYQGKILADFAVNKLNKKSAAILYDVSSDYSTGLTEFFTKRFEELGGKIVAKQAFRGGDVDFRPQLSEIKAKGAEVMFLPILFKEVALAAKQAKDLGLNVVMLGGDGWFSPELMTMAGDLLTGSYVVQHTSWEDPEPKAFYDKYKAKYNQDPELNAVFGYDAVYMMADAIKRAGKVDGEDIRNALEKTKDLKLVHATITIDPKTHDPLNKPAVILNIKDKQFKFFDRVKPSN